MKPSLALAFGLWGTISNSGARRTLQYSGAARTHNGWPCERERGKGREIDREREIEREKEGVREREKKEEGDLLLIQDPAEIANRPIDYHPRCGWSGRDGGVST